MLDAKHPCAIVEAMNQEHAIPLHTAIAAAAAAAGFAAAGLWPLVVMAGTYGTFAAAASIYIARK